MTSLERTRKAVRGEPVDQIPFFPISLASTCRIMGVKQRHFSLEPEVMAETLIAFRERIGCDGIYVSRDNWVYHQALGGEVVFPEDDEPFAEETVLQRMGEFTNLSIPDPWHSPGMNTVLTAARMVVDVLGDSYYIQANIDTGPFSLGGVLLGAERFLYAIMSEEEAEVHRFLKFCTDVVVAYGKAMIETGVHGIQFGDSLASLLGPDHFKQFVLPWEKEAAHSLGDRNCDIWIHICGKTDQFLHLLRNVNIQGFEVDAKVPLPLAGKLLGKNIAVKGNIDTAFLLQAAAQEVYTATLDILRSGGFKTGIIMSPGCGVPRMTPAENLLAIRQACEDYTV